MNISWSAYLPSISILSLFSASGNSVLHTFEKGVDEALWDLNRFSLVWLSNEVMNKQK